MGDFPRSPSVSKTDTDFMSEKTEVSGLSAGPLMVQPESGTFPNAVYCHKFQRKGQKFLLRWLAQTSLTVKTTSVINFCFGSIRMVWFSIF